MKTIAIALAKTTNIHNERTVKVSAKREWLDQIAIAMAFICGVHCLITPILLIALPILGATFWSSSNFHLWMLCFVLPTTALASISGYRRHRNGGVISLTTVGVALLVTATFWERASLPMSSDDVTHTSESLSGFSDRAIQQLSVVANESERSLAAEESCESCCAVPSKASQTPSLSFAGVTFSSPILLNFLGGLLLVRGHWLNFRLCKNCS